MDMGTAVSIALLSNQQQLLSAITDGKAENTPVSSTTPGTASSGLSGPLSAIIGNLSGGNQPTTTTSTDPVEGILRMVSRNERSIQIRREQAEEAQRTAQREASALAERNRLVQETASAATAAVRTTVAEQQEAHAQELRALRNEFASVASAINGSDRRRARPPGSTPPRHKVTHQRVGDAFSSYDGQQRFNQTHNEANSAAAHAPFNTQPNDMMFQQLRTEIAQERARAERTQIVQEQLQQVSADTQSQLNEIQQENQRLQAMINAKAAASPPPASARGRGNGRGRARSRSSSRGHARGRARNRVSFSDNEIHKVREVVDHRMVVDPETKKGNARVQDRMG